MPVVACGVTAHFAFVCKTSRHDEFVAGDENGGPPLTLGAEAPV